ncbi:periplasmic heavy metal sensor [bacterium]|nr:periplasmic heavy metal sensor [bacterium]
MKLMKLLTLALMGLALALPNLKAQEVPDEMLEDDASVDESMEMIRNELMADVMIEFPFFEAPVDEGDFVAGIPNVMAFKTPGFGGGFVAGDMIQKVQDDVNLTKEQRDKIKKIHSELQKLNIPIKSQIELKRIDLKELVDSDSPNKDQIAAKVKEIESLKTQIKINRINARIDTRNILTKEQRDKLDQMRMPFMGKSFGKDKMMKRFKWHNDD